MGFLPIFEASLESTISAQHIVINTVPALILTAPLIRKMSSQALIIDLASKPGELILLLQRNIISKHYGH